MQKELDSQPASSRKPTGVDVGQMFRPPDDEEDLEEQVRGALKPPWFTR